MRGSSNGCNRISTESGTERGTVQTVGMYLTLLTDWHCSVLVSDNSKKSLECDLCQYVLEIYSAISHERKKEHLLLSKLHPPIVKSAVQKLDKGNEATSINFSVET